MALTLVSDPERPLPGHRVKLTFTATVGNYVKVTCTDAPADSKQRLNLTKLGATRIPIVEGDVGKPLDFTPEKPGAYLFTVQEITKGASEYGGGYATDPNANQSEVLVGEEPFTLRVGSRLTMPMGAGPDKATLSLFAWDDTVRQTSEAVHGEATPRIIVAGSSDKAKSSALSTSVLLKLLALVDQQATTLVGGIATAISDLIFQFDAHLIHAGHAASDGDNNIDATYVQPTTPEGIKKSVAEIVRRFTQHIENDNGSGTASAGYHAPGGNKRGDWSAKLISTGTGTLTEALITFADCWRCYEAHRISTDVHGSADTTNDAATLPPLLDLHATYLGGLAPLTPAVPSTANSAVITPVSAAGMREG